MFCRSSTYIENGQVKSLKKLHSKSSTMIVITLLLLMLLGSVHRTHSQSETLISINPEVSLVNPGDNITITVELSNVADLYGWQVAFKYNGSILNLTAAWYPEDHVFAGFSDLIPVTPVVNVTADGNMYLLHGANLLFSSTNVVEPRPLFKANFTVLTSGETAIFIGTADHPIKWGTHAWHVWYSYLLDSNVEEMPYEKSDGTVISGESNARPVALLKITTEKPDNSTSLVIDGNPIAGITYFQAYKGFEITFNASRSHDPDGNISKYAWTFDKENFTTTEPIVTRTYNVTGIAQVTLVVWDDGKDTLPPASSVPVSKTILVGIAYEYFNWLPFEYAVLGIILALAVIQMARGMAVAYQNFRKERQQRRREPSIPQVGEKRL